MNKNSKDEQTKSIKQEIFSSYKKFTSDIEKNFHAQAITMKYESLFLILQIFKILSSPKCPKLMDKNTLNHVKEILHYSSQKSPVDSNESIDKEARELLDKLSKQLKDFPIPEDITRISKDLLQSINELNKLNTKYETIIYEKIFVDSYQSFERFIVSILTILYSNFPKLLLKPKFNLDLESLLDSSNIDNLRVIVIEREIKEIVQSNNIIDLLKTIEKKLSITFEVEDNLLKDLFLASKLRNIVIHNSCIINNVFLQDLKKYEIKSKYNLGQNLSDNLRDDLDFIRHTLISSSEKIFRAFEKNINKFYMHNKSKLTES